MKFERGLGIVIAVMGQDVKECSDEIEAFTSDVRDLEDGADSLANKLGSGLDGFVAVLDENGYFPGAWRLENAGELRYGLLKNLGWANVDFGDHYHDWDVEGEGDSQMLSRLSISCY